MTIYAKLYIKALENCSTKFKNFRFLKLSNKKKYQCFITHLNEFYLTYLNNN